MGSGHRRGDGCGLLSALAQEPPSRVCEGPSSKGRKLIHSHITPPSAWSSRRRAVYGSQSPWRVTDRCLWKQMRLRFGSDQPLRPVLSLSTSRDCATASVCPTSPQTFASIPSRVSPGDSVHLTEVRKLQPRHVLISAISPLQDRPGPFQTPACIRFVPSESTKSDDTQFPEHCSFPPLSLYSLTYRLSPGRKSI